MIVIVFIAFMVLGTLGQNITTETSTDVSESTTSTLTTVVTNTVTTATTTETTATTPTSAGVCIPGADQCSGNGQCVYDYQNLNWTCSCYEGYTGPTCGTQLKYKLTAFLLTFFLANWGAGYFYLAYWGLAGIRLALGVLFCCVVTFHKSANNPSKSFRGGASCFYSILFLWWMIDWILILTDVVPDYPIIPF